MLASASPREETATQKSGLPRTVLRPTAQLRRVGTSETKSRVSILKVEILELSMDEKLSSSQGRQDFRLCRGGKTKGDQTRQLPSLVDKCEYHKAISKAVLCQAAIAGHLRKTARTLAGERGRYTSRLASTDYEMLVI